MAGKRQTALRIKIVRPHEMHFLRKYIKCIIIYLNRQHTAYHAKFNVTISTIIVLFIVQFDITITIMYFSVKK